MTTKAKNEALDELVVPQEYDAAYPIGNLDEHPDNYRIHDEALLDESIGANGFYGVVIVQASTNRILGGHGRWNAMRRAGADTIPVMLLDVDDPTADRILAIDNRANQLGGEKTDPMVRLLTRIQEESAGLLGTGFEETDLESLMASVEAGRSNLGDDITFTEERDFSADAHADKSIDEYRDAYVESAMRSVVLDYPLDRFQALVARLARARELAGVETNSELFESLVDSLLESDES